MRSVIGMIRISSFDAGSLKRAASGFACVRARMQLLEEREDMVGFGLQDSNEDGTYVIGCNRA
jgi:hypothetical protein